MRVRQCDNYCLQLCSISHGILETASDFVKMLLNINIKLVSVCKEQNELLSGLTSFLKRSGIFTFKCPKVHEDLYFGSSLVIQSFINSHSSRSNLCCPLLLQCHQETFFASPKWLLSKVGSCSTLNNSIPHNRTFILNHNSLFHMKEYLQFLFKLKWGWGSIRFWC